MKKNKKNVEIYQKLIRVSYNKGDIMSIAAEFLKQIILVLFYVVLIVLAVRLGINMAKKKNLKNENKQQFGDIT